MADRPTDTQRHSPSYQMQMPTRHPETRPHCHHSSECRFSHCDRVSSTLIITMNSSPVGNSNDYMLTPTPGSVFVSVSPIPWLIRSESLKKQPSVNVATTPSRHITLNLDLRRSDDALRSFSAAAKWHSLGWIFLKWTRCNANEVISLD
jgi:hypothetical protein